mmetsp:Transcript_73621/g.117370  ORF Transcript_73621/g.117370 Transcript_73621/m.117370 type:complete len:121 (+) Transcript_73621:110-472(+)|eukprot:CAMPEP_0197025228 /NCGR_PEP_ID=MMETSP1384-20130603/5627_1 /TAXON_ID=29189 /ORGANISM="Ammonia sp." /LENGTH=120 /DNA_ID=CAMNT_0042453729 /DNA_START=99 /DNA_END=461 /DNA_ORIENTATION=-
MSVVEVDLLIACPACKAGSSQPTYWCHTKCNTRTTITKDGKIGCRNVRGGNKSCSDADFKSCRWACDHHKNDYRYYDKDYAAGSLVKAIADLGLRLADGSLKASEYTMVLQALQKLADSI